MGQALSVFSSSTGGVPLAMPSLMRCDGHYQIDGFDGGSFRDGWAELAIELTSFGGYFRFAPDGACTLKRNHEHEQQMRGAWSVVNGEAIRIDLPELDPPMSLIVHDNPKKAGTVLVFWDGADLYGGVCRYTFVPEELGAKGGQSAPAMTAAPPPLTSPEQQPQQQQQQQVVA